MDWLPEVGKYAICPNMKKVAANGMGDRGNYAGD